MAALLFQWNSVPQPTLKMPIFTTWVPTVSARGAVHVAVKSGPSPP
ncbi:MAG TPA: hypothetical protein VFA84_14790 [Acidimicrobiales bacterium]|nr:hypothetical protein [Acidimicrobiales bacterium]